MDEIWKPVTGYEGLYEVSNLGRVKSLDYLRTGKERILSLTQKPDGHIQAPLFKNGNKNRKYVHVLMAMAFIPIPEKYKNIPVEEMVVHHIDFTTDNRLENLMWMTKDEHDTLHGSVKKRRYSKPVAQYTLDFPCELVKIWPSTREIERELGFSHTNISRCCKKRYGFKSAYGYQWSYWED